MASRAGRGVGRAAGDGGGRSQAAVRAGCCGVTPTRPGEGRRGRRQRARTATADRANSGAAVDDLQARRGRDAGGKAMGSSTTYAYADELGDGGYGNKSRG